MKRFERRQLKAIDRYFIQGLTGFKHNRIRDTVERYPRQLYATRYEAGDGKEIRRQRTSSHSFRFARGI